MSAKPDVPRSDLVGGREAPPAPPAPIGDPFIDEVRAIKYELSARFDHDLEKLAAHLKAVQEDIARREPQRIVRHPRRS